MQVWPAFCTIALTMIGSARVEVGVGEHDLRRLAAELEHALHRVARGRLLHQRADLVASR